MATTTAPKKFVAKDGTEVTPTEEYGAGRWVKHNTLGTIYLQSRDLKAVIVPPSAEPKGGAVKVGKYFAVRLNAGGWSLSDYHPSVYTRLVTWEQLCDLGTPVPLIDPSEGEKLSAYGKTFDGVGESDVTLETTYHTKAKGGVYIESEGGHLTKESARRFALAILRETDVPKEA